MADIRILVLGSGMVAAPWVEYLLRNEKNHVTIACRTLSTAQTVAPGLPRVRAIALDVSLTTELDSQIASHDLIISFVPYVYHASVIKLAIKYKVNVVTTSYLSDAIRELDTPAKEAGVVVLNEVGVDPGVNHLYAIKKIGEVHAKGGLIKEFYSYCGGLPAPERADNPLGFKFSWSPRGALLSQFNSAHFLSRGKQVKLSNKDLMGVAKPYFVLDGYNFVAYPNRNSLPFQEFYGIPEADTVIRGSLRYKGNPKAIGAEDSSENALVSRVKELCQFPNRAESERILSGLRWIGLFSSEQATVREDNLLDTLCAQLEKELSYQPGERDLVILQHKFVIEWHDGKKETFTSTLELYGEPEGYSGMAKSAGVTCGIASQLLLDGYEALNTPGVLAPYKKEICDPVRELLEKEGIKMVEELV
ncbi:MAG: hypothetical protein Q9181_007247 [Wetmoreana brouardii]